MDSEQHQNKGSGHRARLRERFLQSGLDGFSDAEVLELLLSFGTPRKDCKQQARELLKTFKSLPAVLDADREAIQEISGIGPVNAAHALTAEVRLYDHLFSDPDPASDTRDIAHRDAYSRSLILLRRYGHLGRWVGKRGEPRGGYIGLAFYGRIR